MLPLAMPRVISKACKRFRTWLGRQSPGGRASEEKPALMSPEKAEKTAEVMEIEERMKGSWGLILYIALKRVALRRYYP